MKKLDKKKISQVTIKDDLNARKAAFDLGKTAYKAGKITFDFVFEMGIKYLECILQIGSGYLRINKGKTGPKVTGTAVPVITSKQEYIEEVGLSDSYIRKLAYLSDPLFANEFENYKQECFDKKELPGYKEFLNRIKKLNKKEDTRDFIPFIYNIWNTQKGNETEHFGSFPKIFMDNLIYFHTQPGNLIFDPFAGDGTTIDSCKDFNRKYYCTDKIVKSGREKDIYEHDITKGFPEDLPKTDLIFLDPPYWILAKKEYSEDETDLGNMTKDQFYQTMKMIIDEAKKHKIKRIAYLIRPIWETGKDKWEWIDPMFDLYDLVFDKYKIETRYVIPYSTQQYSALWVERAKNKKQCLILNRELTIFKLK